MTLDQAVDQLQEAIRNLRDAIVEEERGEAAGVITDWAIVAGETTFDSDGDPASGVIVYAAAEQPLWKTIGLFRTALEYQIARVHEEDE